MIKKEQLKKILGKYNPALLAALGTFVVLIFLYMIRGMFPFGNSYFMRMDFFHQYAPFMKEFWHKLHSGESLLFSWQNGMGTNFMAIYAYYLASPLNFLVYFVPEDYIVEFMEYFVLLKGVFASFGMTVFLCKTNKINIALAPAFGVAYALSAFGMTYSCNSIWMDVFCLFPLVALGIYHLVEDDDFIYYAVVFAICVFSNFYLSIIAGICSVFWLLIVVVSHSYKYEGNIIKRIMLTILRALKSIALFTVGTLLACGMASVVLFPAIIAVLNTPSGSVDFPNEWEKYFAFYEQMFRLCINVVGNLNEGDYPNIYSSVLAALIVPVYFTNGQVEIRKKISRGFVLLLLLFGFQWNFLDYLWHGFHFPVSFPARQTFFFNFLMIEMAYECLIKKEGLKKLALYISGGLEIIFLAVYIIILKGKTPVGLWDSVVPTMCILVLYCVMLTFWKDKNKLVFQLIPAFILVIELTVNCFFTGIYTVVDRDTYREDDFATDFMLEYIATADEADDGLIRVEEFSRKSMNDAAWNGYNGVSLFSSTLNGGVVDFYKSMGMRYSNVSYSYKGETPFTSSFLGVDYMFGRDDLSLCEDYVKVVKNYDDKPLYVWWNPNALPLGFAVGKEVKNFNYKIGGNPFTNQNSLGGALNNDMFTMFKPITKYDLGPNGFVDADEALKKIEDERGADKTAPTMFLIKGGEQAFIYVSTYVDKIFYETYTDEGDEGKKEVGDLHFKQIVDMGVSNKDRLIVLYSGEDEKKVLNYMVYSMDKQVYHDVIDTLWKNPMEIYELGDNYVDAGITIGEDMDLLTTIPYDKGWTVYVDGVKTETQAFKDAFLLVPLSAGEHELKFKYTPPGYKYGVMISLGAMLVFVLIGAILYKKKRISLPAFKDKTPLKNEELSDIM